MIWSRKSISQSIINANSCANMHIISQQPQCHPKRKTRRKICTSYGVVQETRCAWASLGYLTSASRRPTMCCPTSTCLPKTTHFALYSLTKQLFLSLTIVFSNFVISLSPSRKLLQSCRLLISQGSSVEQQTAKDWATTSWVTFVKSMGSTMWYEHLKTRILHTQRTQLTPSVTCKSSTRNSYWKILSM